MLSIYFSFYIDENFGKGKKENILQKTWLGLILEMA